jgi:hypothetical protein
MLHTAQELRVPGQGGLLGPQRPAPWEARVRDDAMRFGQNKVEQQI